MVVPTLYISNQVLKQSSISILSGSLFKHGRLIDSIILAKRLVITILSQHGLLLGRSDVSAF